MHAWTTPEVELVINHGYIIVQIYKGLHWEKSDMIDMKTKKGGIFNNYINTFLTIKAEAYGYPDNVKTDEDQKNYIQHFEENEAIALDENKIKFNPGLRSLVNLAINYFYRKFGQRVSM